MSSFKEKIAIIGTGNYGISIGKRLLHYGYHVVYGSRRLNIKYLKECFYLNQEEPNFSITCPSEAFNQADNFVILAVAAEDSIYENIAEEIVKNSTDKKPKIVIDISNLLDTVDNSQIKESNAKKLNQYFQAKLKQHKKSEQKISVIKAFNLINSYSFSSFLDSDDKSNLTSLDLTVPIAGDDQKEKQKVIDFCASIGLRAYDIGDLEKGALKLELSNKQTFADWQSPSLWSFLFFIFNFVWIFIIYFLFPKKPQTFQEYLADFSLLSHLNKVLGFTALNLLAFVYFAYIIASIYQLKYSTKYKKFPAWLDYWLKTRKQYGLWAFLIASFHAMASIYMTNPFYLKDWYIKLANNGVGRMTLNGELNIITGIVAYLLMVIVALTSINSIANSLNWSEWRFVQSKMGIACLAMGFLHDSFMYFRIFNERFEFNYDFVYLITRVKLTALYFPYIVLVSRFFLTYFKPISNRLEKIRNGTIVAGLNRSKND